MYSKKVGVMSSMVYQALAALAEAKAARKQAMVIFMVMIGVCVSVFDVCVFDLWVLGVFWKKDREEELPTVLATVEYYCTQTAE